jgi:hypothetical protein
VSWLNGLLLAPLFLLEARDAIAGRSADRNGGETRRAVLGPDRIASGQLGFACAAAIDAGVGGTGNRYEPVQVSRIYMWAVRDTHVVFFYLEHLES